MKKRWLPLFLCLCLVAGVLFFGISRFHKNRAVGIEVSVPSAQGLSQNDITESKSWSETLSANEYIKASAVIKTDAYGYQINDKKKAYFEKGETGDEFQVVDVHTRKTVLTGRIDSRNTGDFSEVTDPGTYYVEAAHIGRSERFTIVEDRYKDMALELYRKALSYMEAEDAEDESRLQILSWILRYADTYTDKASDNLLEEDGQREADRGYLSDCMEIADALLEKRQDEDAQTGEQMEADLQELALYSVVMASLSQKIQAYDREKANTYLKEAVLSYTDATLGKRKETDEAWIFYAAAQLYKVTGQSSYRTVVEQYLKTADESAWFLEDEPDAEQSADEAFVFGLVTYLQTTGRVDVDLCENGMKMLIRQAEAYGEMTEDDFYNGFEGEAGSRLITDRLYVIAIVEHVIVSQEYNNILKDAIHNLGGCNKDGQIYLSQYGILRPDQDARESDAVNAGAYYYLLGQICESDDKEKESIRSEAMESEEP